MTLKRIGVVSCGKVSGILYAIFGLIFGAILSLFAVIGGLAGLAGSEASGPEAIIGAFLGVGAVIFLPVFYGVMGFVFGMLTAALYNLVASFAGGLEIELE